MKPIRILIVLSILLAALGAVRTGYSAVTSPPAAAPEAPVQDIPQLSRIMPDPEIDLKVVRAYYSDPHMVAALAQWTEPWEVNKQEGYVVLGVNQYEYSLLETLGFRLEVDEERTALYTGPRQMLPEQINGIPGFPCYRTVEETFTTATTIVADYPDLAEWIDIGDSWEKTQAGGLPGYDLMVLRLTNENIVDPNKPKFFAMSSIHAREYTTAELNTRFAEYLIQNYGTDPDVTWLLDYNEIHLLLHSNPDGRKHAETGISWRKNTNENYCGAGSLDRGADLNRNYEFQWGCCGGSSGSECAETFRGPSAASEPETQAVQNYVSSIFPDQRTDPLPDPAPADAMGVFLDIHSYSELVLWPWGFTSTPAGNGTALQTLGRRFAYYNNYWPEQSIGLYPTDGTTDDFAYGELGLAAYTFELGTNFFQDCNTFENTIYPDNLPALVYAAKVSRTPYLTPAGPETRSVLVDIPEPGIGIDVTLSATVDDTHFNNQNGTEPTQNIAAANYYVDTPPWDGAAVAHPMTAQDGAFDEKTEGVVGIIDTTGMSTGRHFIYVVGQDTSGSDGPVSAIFLNVMDPTAFPVIRGSVVDADTQAPLDADVQAGVYHTNTDPATGVYTLTLPSGTYDVTASATGYKSVTVNDVALADYQVYTMTFQLPPHPLVQGGVTEAGSGLPLEATVTVGAYQVTSDPTTGAYNLRVPSGTYNLSASAPDHLSASFNNIFIPDGGVVQDFELTPFCSLFSDNVEFGVRGWAPEAPWAITDAASHSPDHAWTDSPDGNYSNGQNVSLVSQPFDLSAYSNVSVTFWYKFNLESGKDVTRLEYSTNGGSTWSTAKIYTGNIPNWTQTTVTLSNLDHQANVLLRFRLTSDAANTADGWYVDDITLNGASAACAGQAAPQAAFIAPSPVAPGDVVTFTNQSSGSTPLYYTWDFGDGIGVSTQESPTYTFAATGTYIVNLTAYNDLGFDSTAQTILVEETPVCSPLTSITLTQSSQNEFNLQFQAGLAPDGAGKPYNYDIDFGDGITTTGVSSSDPFEFSHTYAAPGDYTVTIGAANCAMSTPISAALAVTIPEPPTYGVSIDTGGQNSQEGAPGAQVAYLVKITNTGSVTDTFSVQAASQWVVSMSTSEGALTNGGLLTLAPGEEVVVTVVVSIPAEAASGDQDEAVVTITSQADPQQSQQATLTSSAFLPLPPPSLLYLPLIQK